MKTQKFEIVQVEEVKNLPPAIVNDLQKAFQPLFEQANEWKSKADSIQVSSVEDIEGMKNARETRLGLKNVRVEVEKVRKALKEESLLKGKAIDGIANVVKFLIVPLENKLEEMEKFAEREAEKKITELVESRRTQMSKYVDDVSFYDFRVMSEEAFQGILGNAKTVWEAKQAEAKRLEAERIAKEEAEKEEAERIKKENEKLKAEKEKADQALAEQKRKQAEKEAKVKAANDEKLRKEREAQAEKLRKEREAKEKAERELAEKNAAEARARKEAAEKIRQAELAPDKEKMKALAAKLLDVEYPELKSEEAQKILSSVKDLMKKVNVYIVENIENL